MTKACRTISNLSLAKNLLICLILWSQKTAALQDLEIMDRHREVRVKPGAKIAHFRHRLERWFVSRGRKDVNSVLTGKSLINYKQKQIHLRLLGSL